MRKVRRSIWSQKRTDEKVLSVIISICCISIIILVCMQILGIWKTAVNVFDPLMGVLMLIQTIENWKKNKALATVSLCAAILFLLYSIFIFLIR